MNEAGRVRETRAAGALGSFDRSPPPLVPATVDGSFKDSIGKLRKAVGDGSVRRQHDTLVTIRGTLGQVGVRFSDLDENNLRDLQNLGRFKGRPEGLLHAIKMLDGYWTIPAPLFGGLPPGLEATTLASELLDSTNGRTIHGKLREAYRTATRLTRSYLMLDLPESQIAMNEWLTRLTSQLRPRDAPRQAQVASTEMRGIILWPSAPEGPATVVSEWAHSRWKPLDHRVAHFLRTVTSKSDGCSSFVGTC